MRQATLTTALAASVLAVAAAGCGTSASATSSASGAPRAAADKPPVRAATLILDFTPNAVHAGIYSALAQGYDRAEGIDLHVTAPTASTDSIKLLETGRVDFAILDIHDLAIADQPARSHPNIVGVMAIVERPLAAVIAAPAIDSPRQLPGRTVGLTGDPSDTAVLDSEVAGSGGDPAKVKTITIGFNAVADLLAGRVAGATAFWNDEGVTIQSRRSGRAPFHVFRVDDFGAPSYPELVLCVTRATLRDEPGLVGHVVDALVRGYEFAVQNPRRSAAELEDRASGLDPKLVAAQLHALLPAFRAPDGRVGELNPATLRAWAAWEARFGIVSRPPDVARGFDPGFAGSAPPPA